MKYQGLLRSVLFAKVAMNPGTTDPGTANTMAQPPDDFQGIVPDHMIDAQQNMYGDTENELQRTKPMPSDIDQVPVIAKVASLREAVLHCKGKVR
jgi:hypothetical protein